MVPLPRSTRGRFLLKSIPYYRPPLGGPLPSTACSSNRTRPLPVRPPSDWPRLLLSQTFTFIDTAAISSQLFLFTRPMKMEQCSATSAHKIQRAGNHPKERIQQKNKHYTFCTRISRPQYSTSWKTIAA